MPCPICKLDYFFWLNKFHFVCHKADFNGITTAISLAPNEILYANYRYIRLWIDNESAFVVFQTYNMDAQIGESSACATALMCGVKTNFETVGLDARGRFENCFSSFSSRVSSLIDWAQESGKHCCFSLNEYHLLHSNT